MSMETVTLHRPAPARRLGVPVCATLAVFGATLLGCASMQNRCWPGQDFFRQEFFRTVSDETVAACLEAGFLWQDDLLHDAAAHSSDPAVIRALVAAGSSVDALDSLSRTPLERALDSGNWGVVPTLLEAGADAKADGPREVGQARAGTARQEPTREEQPTPDEVIAFRFAVFDGCSDAVPTVGFGFAVGQ